jgi:hypothetical protein
MCANINPRLTTNKSKNQVLPHYFPRKLLQACMQRTRKKSLPSASTLEDDFTADLAAGVDQEAR